MPITITTWNVQNLRQRDPLIEDKLDFLVSMLEVLGSDVVALQEVLDLDTLQALADRLGFQSFAATPDERGNRVAFLTRLRVVQPEQEISKWRLPLEEKVRSFDDEGVAVEIMAFPRPALQVTLSYNGEDLDIINMHMKSKLLTFSGQFSTTNETLRAQTAYFALQRRAAEAVSLREHASGLLAAGRRLVMVGDFNDVHEAATTQILYGPPGSQPRGPEDALLLSGAFQRPDQGDAQRLFNVANLIPLKIRWSRKHNGQPELLDHILASEMMMPRDSNGLRQVPQVTILNEDTPSLIGNNPNVTGVIPDHAPVTATFV